MQTIERPEQTTSQAESRLILITRGRHSERSEAALLKYRRVGNDYLVVATSDDARSKPDWYLNLKEEPIVQIEISDASFHAYASTPTGKERLRLLPQTDELAQGPDKSIPRETAAILLRPLSLE